MRQALRGFKAAIIDKEISGKQPRPNSLKDHFHGGLRYLQQADLQTHPSIDPGPGKKLMGFCPSPMVLPNPFHSCLRPWDKG